MIAEPEQPLFPDIDEEETVDITSFSGGVQVMNVGLDRAMGRARAAYVDGLIEVEQFEAEVERLLAKGARP